MNLNFIDTCISNIKLKYKSIQKANSYLYPLRIIGQELMNKNQDTIFIMQIVGKNLVSRINATELFKDKQLLNALSPHDLLHILNILNRKNIGRKDNFLLFPCRAHYKLISKSYDHNTQQTIFTIEITQTTKTTQKKFSAFEIIRNPLILEKLSSRETYDLGFTVGSETILKEINKLDKLKKNPI